MLVIDILDSYIIAYDVGLRIFSAVELREW